MSTGTAFFKAEISSSDSAVVQLLPSGNFSSVDGRPKDVPGKQFLLTQESASKVIAKAKQLKNDLFIDYEHQALKAEKNGQPAPAAGWIKTETIRFIDEEGLFADVEWTDKAKQHIENKEYRYISSNITYDKATGEITGLFGAALVNYPAIDGMKAVTELKAENISKDLFAPLCGLLNALGVNVSDNILACHIEHATKALINQDKKINGSGIGLSDVESLKAELNDIKEKLKEVTERKESLDALTSLREQEQIEGLINDALHDGRMFNRDKDEFASYGSKFGSEWLAGFLENRTPIKALSEQQTDQLTHPNKRIERNDLEQEVLDRCGYKTFSDE